MYRVNEGMKRTNQISSIVYRFHNCSRSYRPQQHAPHIERHLASGQLSYCFVSLGEGEGVVGGCSVHRKGLDAYCSPCVLDYDNGYD